MDMLIHKRSVSFYSSVLQLDNLMLGFFKLRFPCLATEKCKNIVINLLHRDYVNYVSVNTYIYSRNLKSDMHIRFIDDSF